VIVAGLALAIGAEDVRAAFPGGNGRIAVFSETFLWPPGPFEVRPPLEPDLVSARIETFLPSGRGRRVLHTLPGGEALYYGGSNELAWSPSGKLLAFEEGRRLAVVRHDGTRLRGLPQLTWRDAEPAWSPNGRRLAFIGYEQCDPFNCDRLNTVRSGLYTVSSDGTGLHRVTNRAAGHPAWSPTGMIAFHSGAANVLYEIRPNGSRLQRLSGRSLQGSYEPEWSPDGRRIVFAASPHRFATNQQIFTARADGRGLRQLTDGDSFYAASPAWSPDGKYIAFIRNSADLWVMRSNGRGLRRVVDVGFDRVEDPYTELSSPSWQPLPMLGPN
jgi:Tol biopolymer transport system component